MQDITTSACTSAEIDDVKQLIDNRDGKKYWIGKLADGNCWMTQNLDLDLTNITLTSADSDVTSSWTPNLISEIWSGGGSDVLKYFDPGMYVYSTPTTVTDCSRVTSISQCTTKGWVNVTGWNTSADSGYNVIADKVNRIYNAHFLVGNHYSWAAATANTSNTITSGSASSSICPKGWQLPISNSLIDSKSFGYLLAQYGLESSLTSDTGYDIRTSPLYFIYSGRIDGGQLNAAGGAGYYWSSTVVSASDAFFLYVGNNSVDPSFGYMSFRYDGQSVRCVAR